MYFMFLADGFEETEALVTLDMLRRASIDIRTVGIGGQMICGAHDIFVKADSTEADVDFSCVEGIILPGGMPGTENLYKSSVVADVVALCISKNLLICAICAAPVILGRRGYLAGRNAVCFPGFEEELSGAEVLDKPCVISDNIITAKGAGCVFEFSHSIIEYIVGAECADNVISVIQHKGL